MSTAKNTKQEYLSRVWDFIKNGLEHIPHTKEDEEKINKIWRFYGRKRNIESGAPKNLAAAIIYLYGRINFMSEKDKKWTQDSIAKICGASKGTISQKASSLMKALKIDMMDQRFAREEVAKENPLLKLSVDPKSGFILTEDYAGITGIPLIRQKEDYYYDAMEYLSAGDADGAIRLLKKALEIDEHFVGALEGLAWSFREKGNMKKYQEYVNKAFTETRNLFPEWPDEMPYGELENRQYLRAICDRANLHWDNNEKEEAEKLFRLLLKLNPNDNQGVRYLIAGMFAGLKGPDIDDLFDEGNVKQNWDKLENLVREQNAKHHFWFYREE